MTDVTVDILQGLALRWEQLSHYAKGNADAALRRCASDLYEVVGQPSNRWDECHCGRLRYQHATGEPCMDGPHQEAAA